MADEDMNEATLFLKFQHHKGWKYSQRESAIREPYMRPEKLVIFWDKDNTDCHTKPVPWQPGINNLLRGIHVWPEPDPVTFTSTLYKNKNRKGTYEDHPWEIVIKNETKSGRRRVIAVGCVDMADYISETLKTFNITVTLKSTNRNIISGCIEFTLTSVMLEDGVPYRPKEELLKEILQDSVKPTSSGTKGTKRRKSGKEFPALPSSDDKILEQSTAKGSSSEAGAIKGPVADINNNEIRIQPRRKAPPPPRPPSTICHKTHAMNATPSVKNTSDIKEVKSSSSQKNGGKRASPPPRPSPSIRHKAVSSAENSPSRLQKGKKKAKPNSFGGSSDEKISFSSPVATSSKNSIEQEEVSTKFSDRKGDGEQEISSDEEQGDGEEKSSSTGVPSSPARWKKPKRTKSKKYPKELNPFGGSSSDEEAVAVSSKEPEMKYASMTRVTDEVKGEQKTNKDGFSEKGTWKSVPTLAVGCDERHLTSAEAVLHPCENTPGREQLPDGSFLCQTKIEDTSHCGAADGITTLNDVASGGDERPSSSKAVSPPCDDTPKSEESPVSSVPCQTNIEDTADCGAADAVTALNDVASGGDERPSSSKAVSPPCQDTAESEESPVSSVPCQTKIEDTADRGAADAVTTLDDGVWGGDERPSSSKAVSPPCEDTPESEESPVSSVPCQTKMEDIDHGSAADGITTLDDRALEGGERRRMEDAVHCDATNSAVPRLKKKAPPKPPRPSLLRKKKLLASETLVFQKCPDLSAYAMEEMKLLQEEIITLDKVTVKLKTEMNVVMKIKECKEELNGLIQDWLSLMDYRDELSSRKRDLQILDKQEDFEQCCKILRSELKLLFKQEEWRKTDAMKSQEVKVMNFLTTLTSKRREN